MGVLLCKELRFLVLTIILVMWGVGGQLPITESPAGYSDFCSRRMAVKVCPTPPTVNNLDLHTFLGSYFEVGATARYKLKSETGMVCSQSNFSADSMPPPEDQTTVVTMDVINSGVKVMGLQSISALSKIAYSASDVCANAARMCAMLDPSSKLSDALFRIGFVAAGMSPASPSDTEVLRQASATINLTVSGAQGQLDALSRSISVVSRISAELNQGLGPVDSLLRALRTLTSLGDTEIRHLGSNTIGNLTATRRLISQVISHISDANSVELLSEASTLIEQEIDLITSQVTRVQGLLGSIGGPLADMIAADRSSTNSSASLVTMTGKAIQNSDQRGNMALKSGQVTQPYKIIGLEGLPVVGYSSILVYSCLVDSNGDPAEDLVLLSRAPNPTAQTVNNLLNTASRYGIFTECDNVFVPTVQRGGACGVSSSQ